MENIEISFTLNLTAIFTGIAIYLLVCLIVSVSYMIHITLKQGYLLSQRKQRNFWKRRITEAVIKSPLIPLVFIEELIHQRRNRSRRKTRQESK